MIIALTAFAFTIHCILLLSTYIGGRLYKKWLIDGLETFFYFNIVFFVIFIWHSLGNTNPGGSRGEAVAYTSVIITFIVLLLIVLYHVYTYTTVFSKVKKLSMIGIDFSQKLIQNKNRNATVDCHLMMIFTNLMKFWI